MYVSAHGLYSLKINGVKGDDREFAPENTTYFKRLQYQTYDVTGMIRPGENVFALILADGWWAGRIGTTGDCCQYGNRLGLLLEAVLEYSDGTRQVISGEDGVSSTGSTGVFGSVCRRKIRRRKRAWRLGAGRLR